MSRGEGSWSSSPSRTKAMEEVSPHTLHIVCGLPAVGKTYYGLNLARKLGAAFLDSDTTTDLMIQAAHRAAGIDPHDRDSTLYKKTYREPVYDTLFAIAVQNLGHTDVIIAGPFTSELKKKEEWKELLEKRFAPHIVQLHHLEIEEEKRMEQMRQRGAKRDVVKLAGYSG